MMENREIKFRAYDFNEKDIVSWKQILDGLIDMYYLFRDDDPSFALMQYTGLKDKNGVEIYEGDILEINGRNDYVEYSDIIGCFVGGKSKSAIAFHNKQIEVVGNIHENPELL